MITTWPENKKGAITLSFDEACPSQVSLGIPALDAQGFKGTFFLVTNDIGGGWAPGWDSWKNAADNGHEIASHAMNHPRLTLVSLSQVQNEMAGAKAAIDARISPKKCLTFAYPSGDLNGSVESIARHYFIASRGTSCGLNGEPYDFHNVRACSPDDGDDIYAQADAAQRQGKWLVVFLHTLDGGRDGCRGSYEMDLLTTYLGYMKVKNLWVGTFGAVSKYIKERATATLFVLSSASDQIVLDLTDTMDDAIYDQPLTIRSDVPSGWGTVTVQQGSSKTDVLPVVEGATKAIYYNVVPDRGLITLRDPLGWSPRITSLGPQFVTTGSLAFPVTVSGSNFVNGSKVLWNSSARETTFVSATQLRGNLLAADIATTGTIPVTVINPDGRLSNAMTVEIRNPLPTVTDLSPAWGTSGDPSITLTVYGSNFISGSKVRWKGSDRATGFHHSGEVQATISATDVAAAGAAGVTVYNPPPGGGTSNAINFDIYPVPAALPVNPSISHAGATRTATRTVSPKAGEGTDLSAPYAADWSPQKGATGVPITNREILFHIRDNVDVLTDNGSVTIEGSSYTCGSGITCIGNGTSDLAVTYTQGSDWSNGQEVNVITSGFRDTAGNVMATDTWSYTTEPAGTTLTIATTTLPNGVLNQAYSQTILATGGTTPYTFTTVSGSFPTGLTLSSAGVISGTATAAGTYSFTVRATDAVSATADQALSIVVSDPRNITTINDRYFVDASGTPKFLVGYHDYAMGSTRVNYNFIVSDVLNAYAPYGLNYIRMLVSHPQYTATTIPPSTDGSTSRTPFLYVGGKVDLDQWDPVFWTNLKEDIVHAASHNVIAHVAIFDGVNFWRGSEPWRWGGSDWNIARQTKSFFGDLDINRDGDADDGFYNTTAFQDNTGVGYYQKRLIDKTIAETSSYPNVMYEVGNETDTGVSSVPAWVDAVAAYVKTLTTKPVTINICQRTNACLTDDVANKDADIQHHSDTAAALKANIATMVGMGYPAMEDPDGPALMNASPDELRRAAWYSLTGGAFGWGGFTSDMWTNTVNTINTTTLTYYGYLLSFLDNNAVRFWEMTPQPSLISTNSTNSLLANVGSQYLGYILSGATAAITLGAGDYKVTYFNPATGATTTGTDTTGPAIRTFNRPPGASDWAVFVYEETSPVYVTTTSLDNGTVMIPYSATLMATGGVPSPYTWSILSGALPTGLNLSSAGVISGTPTTAETASFTVEARDTSGNAGTKAFTITVSLETVNPVLSSVTASPSTVVGGSPSTGTVTLSGPAPTGGGSIVSLGSDNTSAATVPASVTVPAGASSATFEVTTSPVSGSTAVTISASYGGDTRTAPLAVTPVATAVTLGAAPGSPQLPGINVTFTAAASGGSGTYEYQFLIRNPAGVWSYGRTYASSPSWIWTTTGLTTGTYYIQVQARSAGRTAAYDVYTGMDYALGAAAPPATAVTLGAAPGSPQLPGINVTFTAAASGGSGTYEYQFLIRNPAGVWSYGRTYASSPSWIWTTTGLATGTYYIQVQARSAGRTAYYDVYTGMDYALGAAAPPATAVTLGASPGSPQLPGTSITFTGAASGGSGTYEYQFLIRNLAGVWSYGRTYASSPSWIWTTTGLATGTYYVQVQARSAGRTAYYDVYTGMDYALGAAAPPATAVTLGASPGSPQPLATNVTFTGAGSGGSGTYEYQFLVRNPAGIWSYGRTYASSPSWIWNAAGLATGTYYVQVQARSVGRTAYYDVYTGMDYIRQ